MIARLRAAWAKAPWLMTGFALALALTLYFGSRMIAGAIYWADPRHQDQDIAGWMSPGYIAMSWDIPREVMVQMLPRPDTQRGPTRLDDIATAQDVPLSALIEQIEEAIQTYRDANP